MSNIAGGIVAENDAKGSEIKKATTRQRRKSRDLGVTAIIICAHAPPLSPSPLLPSPLRLPSAPRRLSCAFITTHHLSSFRTHVRSEQEVFGMHITDKEKLRKVFNDLDTDGSGELDT